MMKKTAFVCDTPYQLFNILNLIFHNENDQADLFLSVFFDQAESVYKRLIEKKVFHNVTLIKPHYRERNEGRWHWYLRHARTYLRPNWTLCSDVMDGTICDFRYDEIYACSMISFTVCLLQVNPDADFFLVEDGIGSYLFDNVHDGISRMHKIFSKLLHVGANVRVPRCLYLYETSQFVPPTKVEIRSMPHPTHDFLKYAADIFGQKAYRDRSAIRWIWLTQPIDGNPQYQRVDDEIRNVLLRYRESVLVRKHPRDERENCYKDFCLDDKESVWELNIPNMDIDGKVLIGNCSTAQFVPKLIYDREPRLIFTNLLYGDIYRSDWYLRIIEAIGEFRRLYRQPDKIGMPETIEEFEQMIKML